MKNRVPILVWGDLVDMAKPVVRRTLVGQRAHECMYAWVYLTDYLLVKRIATTLKGMKLDKAMLLQALGTFTTNREIDPHYQHNLEAWTLAAITASIAAQSDDPIEVAELGQTFFSLKNKVDVLQPAYPAKCAIKWTGIDNSSFAVEVAKILQGETDDINFFKDHRDYSINQEVKRSIFTSRFVSSYAFTSTAEFIAFLTKHNFDAMVLDEPFNAGRSDLKTYNHGLPICYFQLDELNHFAISNGYQIEVIDWYPDNPARSGRCLNIKLAIQRKGTPSVAHVSRDLSLDHNYKLLASNFTTEDLLHQITADRWRQVDQFKFQNPVWSKTPAEITSSSLYMWAREFAATTYHKWRAGIIRTTLRGQNVQNEIRRYLSEEHSNSNHQKRE